MSPPPLLIPISSLTLNPTPLHVTQDTAVHVATYKASHDTPTNNIPTNVVVKRFLIRSSDSVRRFEWERDVVNQGLTTSTSRVISPLAYVQSPPEYWLVFPMYVDRDLETFAQMRHPGLHASLCLLLDMSRSLQYVHTAANLIHRDVKLGNFLMVPDHDNSLVAMLGDFGSSIRVGGDITMTSTTTATPRVLDDYRPDVVLLGSEATGPSGGYFKKVLQGTTLLFAAPEIITLQSTGSQASDVYALAVCWSQLLTGERPYETAHRTVPALNTVVDASYSEQALLSCIVNDKLRPVNDVDVIARNLQCEANTEALVKITALLSTMWVDDPHQRPSSSQVVDMLEKLLRDVGEFDESNARKTKDLKSGSDISVPTAAISSPPKRIRARAAPSITSTRRSPFPLGSFCTSGRRGKDKMEDRHVMSHYSINSNEVFTLVLMIDGHGGCGTADYAVKELELAICESAIPLLNGDDDKEQQTKLEETITRIFIDTDLSFRNQFPQDTSGATVLAVMLWSVVTPQTVTVKRIITANAGDCRALIGRRAVNDNGREVLQPIRVTQDHNLDCETERKRVVANGGQIVKDANGVNRVNGYLQVTRSFGDAVVKNAGVVASPEIRTFVPGNDDVLLVIASDGLFEVMSDNKVVDLVCATAKEPGLAAKRLGAEAVACGSGDNCSVVVGFLTEWSEGFSRRIVG